MSCCEDHGPDKDCGRERRACVCQFQSGPGVTEGLDEIDNDSTKGGRTDAENHLLGFGAHPLV